jgi:transmembrane sensor
MLREALTFDALRAMTPDEAAALLVARRAEGLTASEQAMLADWLAADAGHGDALGQAERAWNSLDDAEGDELLAAMRAHALAPVARRSAGWRVYAAAAAAVLLVLVSTLLLFPSGRQPDGEQIAMLDYVSVPGQVREIALPDGSTMTLDADSMAKGRFGTKERSIELMRGRALFQVKKDPSRPFAVSARDRRVVALGTEFAVNLAGDSLKVMLFEGRVAVEPQRPGAKTVMLEPGQLFVEREGTAAVRGMGISSEAATGWRHGLISLNDVPLGEAVAEINRYSGDRIVIRDPAVAAMRVTGQFRAGDAQRFAGTVAEIHPVRVVRRGNAIEIVPAR